MTDPRPTNCRFRLQDEGKSYPRSSCTACHRGILTGLGTSCAEVVGTPTPAPNAGAVKVNEEQNTEQRKVFWNWLPLAYRDGHIGEEPKFSKYNMEVAHYAGWAAALETTPDPRDEVIARLVEAAEKLASWDHCWPGNINLEWEIGKLRAALAAAKEVMK